MFKKDHLKFILGIVCICFFVMPTQAYGYIDPGTGSMIVQALIAFIIAVPFVIKTYWNRLKNFFSKNK